MANITQVEINGTTYDICDATARDSITRKSYTFDMILNSYVAPFKSFRSMQAETSTYGKVISVYGYMSTTDPVVVGVNPTGDIICAWSISAGNATVIVTYLR